MIVFIIDNLDFVRKRSQFLYSVSFENTEGGPLFCAPVKFQGYYQYANKQQVPGLRPGHIFASNQDGAVHIPPEGRTLLAQWRKFSTQRLDSVMRKNEPKIEMEMKFFHVLNVLLDGCQKIIAWMYSTQLKMQDTMIDARIIG